MGYIFELILMFGMCACAVGMVYFSVRLLMTFIPTKQWDRKMKNPPPPPRKPINYGYQPTNKVDTSNPPKETGT